jgi:hypothetical protein
MAGEQHSVELEIIGDDDIEPVGSRVWHRLRERPRLLVALALLLLAAGPAAAWIAVPAAWRQLHGPATPTLSISSTPTDPPQALGWDPGPDGRPLGDTVSLSFEAALRLTGTPDGAVTVVGISGPGVRRTTNPPIALRPGDSPRTLTLGAAVDCTAVPRSGAEYRLRTRVRTGTRTVTRDASAGAAGRQWQAAIGADCGSWTARRDLTVTDLVATVDPERARLRITTTIRNAGRQAASVTALPVCCDQVRTAVPQPLTVPPGGQAGATFTVLVDSCDAVVADFTGAAPLALDAASTDQIGLGARGTGIVLGRDAASSLDQALRQACGGLGVVVTLLSPGSVHYQRDTGRLEVRVTIEVSPGKVRRMRLSAGKAGGDTGQFRPLWTTIDTVPDRTGQVEVDLTYTRPAGSSACPDRGGFLPQFDALLQVPDRNRVRQVRFRPFVDLAQDPSALPQLCSNG